MSGFFDVWVEAKAREECYQLENVGRIDRVLAELTARAAEMKDVVIGMKTVPQAFNFRLWFVGTKYGLSICNTGKKKYAETALLLSSSAINIEMDKSFYGMNLEYDAKIGYRRVCTWDNVDDLIKEILRVRDVCRKYPNNVREILLN
ncbi:MAG: hypothetical protein Harvfovirus3_67 [Harvfovirus sp.]|uniref:Uncharacterized protein n=1 Tax=Harvfovirus sp. TaxID=2487768 RepID=A0A3G5A0D9_9VIRU|nr:MAG: hypothetical protein Harvfovirus3_67 [Harvfovirus sp.]